MIQRPVGHGALLRPPHRTTRTSCSTCRPEPPALSGDGYKVAFLVGPVAAAEQRSGNALDLFLTDMRPGLSRKASTVELTREGRARRPRASSSITGLSMSGDGRGSRSTRSATSFVLPEPALGRPARGRTDWSEVYLLDLDAMEIERVDPRLGRRRDQRGHAATGLSISDDGARSRSRRMPRTCSSAMRTVIPMPSSSPEAQPGSQAGPASRRTCLSTLAVLARRPAARGRADLRAREEREARQRQAGGSGYRRRPGGGSDALPRAVQPKGVRKRRHRCERLRAPASARRGRGGDARAAHVEPLPGAAAETGRLTARLLVSFTPAGGGGRSPPAEPSRSGRSCSSGARAVNSGEVWRRFGDVLDNHPLSTREPTV